MPSKKTSLNLQTLVSQPKPTRTLALTSSNTNTHLIKGNRENEGENLSY